MPYKRDRPCIYGIYCKSNSKLYIGSSKTVYHRLAIHKSLLRANTHFNIYLQRTYNKYGEDNFQFTVIEEVENIWNLLQREQWYIDTLGTLIPDGFNIAKDTKAPMAGKKHSNESKLKMSLSQSGKNNAMFGRKHTKESKRKMSKSTKEMMTDEHKAFLSELASKRTGKRNSFHGKSHNNTTRDKIRKARQVFDKNQISHIRELLNQKLTHQKIADKLGVSRSVITNIALGNTYKTHTRGKPDE